ncbi:MAG: hypothetical protein KGH61_00840 [Candidatus Micrarchaeota archaeon]|nr:hypothetical protein [Candidatus Micrarchaeota archaeon]MDE1847481.1 hypothetical protein [Candidatus Micrarchaeota archaeon]
MLQAERKTGEVIPLPSNFYKEAQQQSAHIEVHEAGAQHKANFKKLLETLKERRLQKLLIYLAYNKQLPTLMPEEEWQIYNKIKNIINSNEDASQKLKKLRIAADLPELMMPNGSKTGPYKQNQTIETGNDYETQFLINNKLAEPI